jgi:hypothetical protein
VLPLLAPRDAVRGVRPPIGLRGRLGVRDVTPVAGGLLAYRPNGLPDGNPLDIRGRVIDLLLVFDLPPERDEHFLLDVVPDQAGRRSCDPAHDTADQPSVLADKNLELGTFRGFQGR